MILCCGEALIDMIPTRSVKGPDGFVPHPGGSVFNTAIALGRLGVETGMLSGISTDLFGQKLMTALSDSHVDTALVVRSDRPSTLAFVQLTDGQASYSFFDENSAGRMLQSADFPGIPKDVSALYFGGISLACEPAADAYTDLLMSESTHRAVMVDPNIRSAFIQDIERYQARIAKVIAHADVVKVSDEDLNWLHPGPATLREKVDLVLEAGPSLVILTMGGEGATGYLSNGTEVFVPAREVTIVDTVGAGDTFNAGVLCKLSELGVLSKKKLASLSENAVKEALAYGSRVAAVTVSRPGADPPRRNELEGS